MTEIKGVPDTIVCILAESLLTPWKSKTDEEINCPKTRTTVEPINRFDEIVAFAEVEKFLAIAKEIRSLGLGKDHEVRVRSV